MEEWNDLIGKDLMVIFEDGENHFSKKSGELIGANESFIILRTSTKKEGIAIRKVIRFEEVGK